MGSRLKYLLLKNLPVITVLTGSFLITAGWQWYHYPHKPHLKFVLASLAVWVLITIFYKLGKKLFLFLTKKFNRHNFWYNDFATLLDKIFFTFSLFFLVLFLKDEVLSLSYFTIVLILFFYHLHTIFKKHPGHQPWIIVNRNIAIFTITFFLLNSSYQFLARRYYILDPEANIDSIVLFRALAMTLFWLFGLSIGGTIFTITKNWWRYIWTGLWVIFFITTQIFWIANIGILYFSGLYLSPVMLQHTAGGGNVIWNWLTFILIVSSGASLIFFGWRGWCWARAHHILNNHAWRFYYTIIIVTTISSFLIFTSFKTAPEFRVAKNFYNYFTNQTSPPIILDPVIQNKLHRFGLNYNLDEFYVSHHNQIFTPTNTIKLLPDKFKINKLNILIVFLESFSSRLTSVYNNKYPGLTPGLENFAANPHTTIFKNYYNASTPTITGLMSGLCSFLPPTGNTEIETNKRIQSHHLLCLPQILKNNGYQNTSYITAVEKEFSHKDSLFGSMGVDNIFGTEELKKYISGVPLAWGYSDHQMFPATANFMDNAKQPFLIMLSTVDTHPPFNIAKDMINYGDGTNPVLNSIHTTDNAFDKFWQNFVSSSFYQNTIVIAVADHAIFPTAVDKNLNPEIKKLTFYDENTFLMYIPDSTLPKTIDTYSSSLDFAPSLLQLLNINTANAFEGHSIFDDRKLYPNLIGMHEFGLYTNQLDQNGKRMIDYNLPTQIKCDDKEISESNGPLTLCEFLQFYNWKRQMFEQGRFWE